MKATNFRGPASILTILLFLGFASTEANERVTPEARNSISTKICQAPVQKQPPSVPAPEKGSVLIERRAVEAGWKWIVNQTFGFALRVPASSHIDPSPPQDRFEYIQIQNYKMDDAGDRLEPNTYWLDIYLFHHKGKAEEPRNPCPGEVLNPNIETKDGLKVYTGDVLDKAGEAGGWIRGLCVETGVLDISIHAAENKKSTPLVNRILKSFRFMPKPEKWQ